MPGKSIQCLAATCKNQPEPLNPTKQFLKILEKCSNLPQEPICGMRTHKQIAGQTLPEALESIEFLACQNSSVGPAQINFETELSFYVELMCPAGSFLKETKQREAILGDEMIHSFCLVCHFPPNNFPETSRPSVFICSRPLCRPMKLKNKVTYLQHISEENWKSNCDMNFLCCNKTLVNETFCGYRYQYWKIFQK